jgi:GPH family glycoside/pentoside/hexuronide:cation symporter
MNQEEIIQRDKSTKGKFLIFGMPTFGTAIIMGFADFALLALYHLAYQLPPIPTTIALGLGKLTIAASQFFFGWISDAKYTRWGRRKPYLIILSPILGLSFILLLLPSLIIDLNDKGALFIWLFVWYQIFNLCYGVTTPFGSWMTEQFRFDDRPKASQYLQFFGMVGTATITVFSMVVLTDFINKIQANPDIIPPEFLFGIIIFGIIPVVLYFLVSFLMPTEPHFKIESNLIQNLKTILKNKNYIKVTIMIGLASMAWTIIANLILEYIIVVLLFDPTINILAAAIFVLGILIFLYMWRRLLHKLGKKRSLLYIFLLAILFLPSTLLGIIPMNSSIIFGMLFLFGLTACVGGWYLLPPVLISDITEDDEKTTGELKAGIYKGFPSILLNLFQIIGLIIIGILLELPDITVGTSKFSIGYVIWGPICSLILLFSYLYSKKFLQLDFAWEKNQ